MQKHAQQSQSHSPSQAQSHSSSSDCDDRDDDGDDDGHGDDDADSAIMDGNGLVSVLAARMEEVKRDLLVLTLDVVETQAV